MSRGASNSIYARNLDRVIPWQVDLVPDLNGLDELVNCALRVIDPCENENDVTIALIVNTFHLVNEINNNGRGRIVSGHGHKQAQMDFRILRADGGIMAAGEVKPFWVLNEMPVTSDLITAGFEAGRNTLWGKALRELHGYMYTSRVRYGMLTSFNHSWFCRVVVNGQLEISERVSCDAGNIISRIIGFMELAARDETGYPVGEVVHTRPGNARIHLRRDGRGGGSGGGRGRGTGVDVGVVGRRRKRGENDDIDEDELIGWNDVHVERWLGSGRMGSVVEAVFRGQHVAVKSVTVRRRADREALDIERGHYKELKRLQGVCIPHVIKYNYGRDAGVMDGFIMQLLRQMPDDFEDWTRTELAAGRKALKMLAEQGGYQQGDVRGANFGWDEATRRMLVFDLEDLQPISAADCRLIRNYIAI